MARSAKVLVLDDDEDLCELVCDLLAFKTGTSCVVAHSVAEMIEKQAEVLDCAFALLDVNLGHEQPSGLDAHAWLAEHAFTGTIAFLTGHARMHPALQVVSKTSGIRVFEKPLITDALVSLVTSATEHRDASP